MKNGVDHSISTSFVAPRKREARGAGAERSNAARFDPLPIAAGCTAATTVSSGSR
ncbi:hypothetical protein HNR47_001038 [Methylopila jiangsuensis]|uniref:hypothetical protein n=1 Tax=Methylopila jiangsuensis TaxID=586230 RepID=UPI0022F32378|nr:hypothetical protein [Methylopila jiangsuensis]MDR6285055.1 hypothetical protein [Methylopila jiangsuensis]